MCMKVCILITYFACYYQTCSIFPAVEIGLLFMEQQCSYQVIPVNIFCLVHLPLKETLSSKITDKIKVFLEDSCKAKGIPDVSSETTACSSDWAHAWGSVYFALTSLDIK